MWYGGVGSIITGLKHHKKIIAVPRLKKYKEHTNDHQIQIVDAFAKDGYILKLDENGNICDRLNEIKKFNPKVYKSNNKQFLKLISNEINNYL